MIPRMIRGICNGLGSDRSLRQVHILLLKERRTDGLQRRFQFASIVGHVIVLGLTWEFTLVTSIFSLANGGTAGAIWLTFVVCCGMFTSVRV